MASFFHEVFFFKYFGGIINKAKVHKALVQNTPDPFSLHNLVSAVGRVEIRYGKYQWNIKFEGYHKLL